MELSPLEKKEASWLYTTFNKMYHLKVKWQAISGPNMTYLKMLIVFIEKDILNPDYAIFLFCLFKHSKNLPEARCWEKVLKERKGKLERLGS